MRASVLRVTGGRSESRSCSWVYMEAVLLNGRSVAQGIVVEAPPLHAPDGRQQLIVVRRVVDRIDCGRVDDEKRRCRKLMEETRIRLVESDQVVTLDVLLVADAAPGDALEQHIDRGLQIDYEVRLRSLDVELGVDLLVESEFGVIQCHPREQAVFFQQVVCHAHPGEEILLIQGSELLAALEEEMELCGQRARPRVAVEALEKRVLRGILQHRLRREAVGQTAGEARLADPDRSFHHDELVLSPAHAFTRNVEVGIQGSPRRSRPSGVSRPLSPATRPSPGTSRSGARSARGYRTKFRSTIPGWGRLRSGSSRRSRP